MVNNSVAVVSWLTRLAPWNHAPLVVVAVVMVAALVAAAAEAAVVTAVAEAAVVTAAALVAAAAEAAVVTAVAADVAAIKQKGPYGPFLLRVSEFLGS